MSLDPDSLDLRIRPHCDAESVQMATKVCPILDLTVEAGNISIAHVGEHAKDIE